MSATNGNASPKDDGQKPDDSASGSVSITPTEICRVGVRIPPFWPEEPEIWFAQIEGQFAISNINQDATKFNYVIGQLDQQFLKEVKDIIISPPATNKYEKLKTELIKRLTASKDKKVLQLTLHEELGDRKPSQFLRHLQSLGGPSIPDDFVRIIWISRLPNNIQTIIAAQPNASLEDLAELADRVQDIAAPTPQVASTSASGVGSSLDAMANEIAELKKHFQSMNAKLDRKSRSPRRSNINQRRQDQPGRRSNSSYRKYPICWFHTKFGKKATRCVKPCDFGPENFPDNQ